MLSQPMVFGQYLDAAKVSHDIALYDWAPKDQFSVGAMILSRKSFTPQQARHWDAFVADHLRDGTILKLTRDSIYSGPRAPD